MDFSADFLRKMVFAILLISVLAGACIKNQDVQYLPLSTYRDKAKGAWVGQMIGVTWGYPTEFKYNGRIIPISEFPLFKPRWLSMEMNSAEERSFSAFNQDDLFIEATFLEILDKYGLSVTSHQIGYEWAHSPYDVQHANKAGLENLLKGIAPPDSGHPEFNAHCDDIDYQIESDFSGIVSPGLPNTAIELGQKFGSMMNYGDGIYGGQFVGGMYSAAFFETNIERIVQAGLACIPARSQYAEMVRDVSSWWKKNPRNWLKTWDLVEQKYHHDPRYLHGLCSKNNDEFCIDAKLNGAYILIGLLYGQGDFKKTAVISMRCGQDSDCNPSNALGIVGTMIGFSGIPSFYVSHLDMTAPFYCSNYNLTDILSSSEKIALQAVKQAGGSVQLNSRGAEILVIPVQSPRVGKLQQSYQPAPQTNSRFSIEEVKAIRKSCELAEEIKLKHLYPILRAEQSVFSAFGQHFPGWKLVECGRDMNPGFYPQFQGRTGVFLTHPLSKFSPAVITRTVTIPSKGKTILELEVGHHPRADWDLIVTVDGKEVKRTAVSKDTAHNSWLTSSIDLTAYAGKNVELRLLNYPSGYFCEAAYWKRIEIVH
ncbi:ADP-ribosylglycohydrolase family protein [candidate division CSSED10-310 bacterium]|uniref:ADP-ribosylglycohydrolase family protein n=1 Tax=candidate division CSSED10-310 bacterium TaxID=2855610 RepID=A0ABV6YX83_UNCC1